MDLEIIETDDAPRAHAPLSQGIRAGSLLFVSGQLGRDPQTRELDDTIEAQATRALKNLQAVVEAGGSSLEKVVKTTVYLKNIEDFAAMNDVYRTFFRTHLPTRTCYQAGKLVREAFLIEVDCIAVL